MQMKKSLLSLLATAVLGLSSAAASATTLSGDWIGSWSGSGINATFNMTVGPQNGLGQFSGSFNWTCTSTITCSGTEYFSGVVALNDTFTFQTTGFLNPVNLAAGSYWGSIVNNGNSLVGFDQGPQDRWSANRVVSVPEPGSLALMVLGLLGVALAVRRKLPAANNSK